MTDYEIEDLGATIIPNRGLNILTLEPIKVKRLVWQWKKNGEVRTYSYIIQSTEGLSPSALVGQLDACKEDILEKYPDEVFHK
ncbi:hypothetical protein LJQ72_09370 [Pectobacterium brasiliense]|uniref:hypothetical protein n=1 Tax=Pectobacterium brasiliense TaxID=180957 RepID=UPI001D0CF6BA|nr:hypothetical protein [Pectobacterium brasiliense]UDQ77737.1 hypothetical protein LJQ72_09370 [Pectobacterium brasiliense]